MPILAQPEVKPTVVVQPDMRFATTFLSTKYRDYAVPGEAIMDKVSGELFMKRASDGKVISFSQNKKMIHDLVFELRVLLTNNERFFYPLENESAFYVSTNYDLIAMHNEALYNLVEENIEVPNGPDTINKLTFKVAGTSNGFFCRHSTRDCDKPFIEFLTNQFNLKFEKYDGEDPGYLDEKEKFDTIPRWKDSNVILTYTLEVYKGATTRTYNLTDYIRFNEEMAVIFPEELYRDFPTGVDYYNVTINKFDYYKIHYMIEHKDTFGNKFTEAYNKLISTDGRIEPNECNIMHFVNEANDIDLLGNEIILAFLDIPYVTRYMSKMAKLKSASQFITSITRPNNIDWGANTVWAERLRDVHENGEINETGTSTKFYQLEMYFAPNTGNIVSGNIVDDPTLTEDFLLEDI